MFDKGNKFFRFSVYESERFVVVSRPDGVIDQSFSDAFTDMWRSRLPDRKYNRHYDANARKRDDLKKAEVKRIFAAFLRIFDVVGERQAREGEKRRSSAELFMGSPDDVRWVVKEWLQAIGCKLEATNDYDNSYWVKMPRVGRSAIFRALAGAVFFCGFHALAGHYGGNNPMKVDPKLSRVNREGSLRMIGNARHYRYRADADNIFRVSLHGRL